MRDQAVRHLFPDARPDLVLSGVNHGQNAAEDVTYSGNRCGGHRGDDPGIPAIALSQAYGARGRDLIRWGDGGSGMARDVIRRVLKLGIPSDSLVIVNSLIARPTM